MLGFRLYCRRRFRNVYKYIREAGGDTQQERDRYVFQRCVYVRLGGTGALEESWVRIGGIDGSGNARDLIADAKDNYIYGSIEVLAS